MRAKLLEGGAVDAVNYGPDCNHVIVDNLLYVSFASSDFLGIAFKFNV